MKGISYMKFKKVLNIIAAFWVVFLYFTAKPALNLHSVGFWFFLMFAVAPFLIININYSLNPVSFFKDKNNKYIFSFAIIFVVTFILLSLLGSPLLGGLNNYRNRISVPNDSNIYEIEEFRPGQVQVIDKNISSSLADRVFGEMGAEIVSQFQISDNYASVVVNDVMYRLTPVEYSGFIKWLSTNSSGTPGFISVNVENGDTVFHKTNNGLKYMENACFFNSLDLHLRLKYPTYIFGQNRFEVDDNFNPYWVSEVMTYNFIGKTKDVKGIVITNPYDGDSKYYDVSEVPSWVDNVYNASLICEQYNDYGKYKNGLFNFAQKGVTAVTDDYAYLQKDSHLWMYTGVTSVGNDESNVGFIYVDLQDKEVIYIVSAGAEEYSARASAEGALQEKGYISVFPTMVRIGDEFVYFMGLKDNAGLIKAYAFVSYKNYQKVGIGETINEALKDYTGKNTFIDSNSKEIEIEVLNIASAVIDGYTTYFIETIDNNYYKCSIEISDRLPFIKTNDKIKVIVSDNQILEIK